jgi:CBS domain-containing protein
MRRFGIGCLPVLHDGKLVGLITEEDFMDLATKLLEEQMGATEQLLLPLEPEKK